MTEPNLDVSLEERIGLDQAAIQEKRLKGIPLNEQEAETYSAWARQKGHQKASAGPEDASQSWKQPPGPPPLEACDSECSLGMLGQARSPASAAGSLPNTTMRAGLLQRPV
jgi:hypothetical protein